MRTQRLCVVCASPIQGRPQKLYCGETCIKRAYRARHGLVHPRPLGRLRRLEAERDAQARLIARLVEALKGELPGCWHLEKGADNYCRAQPPVWQVPPEPYDCDPDWTYFCAEHKPDDRRVQPYTGDEAAWAVLADAALTEKQEGT